MAVTSPGKSMVAGASKGRGIGRGNFYHAVVLRLIRLVPRSSVLLLGFSAIFSVSLVSRFTTRSMHDNMLGCQSPSVSGHEISRRTTWSTVDYGSLHSHNQL